MTKEQWAENLKLVAALRSGEFKQAKGTLRDVSLSGEIVGYCCLGVECQISSLGTWDIGIYNVNGSNVDPEFADNYNDDSNDALYNYASADGGDGELPWTLMKRLGWASTSGQLDFEFLDRATHGVGKETLIECNDRLELTFDQIADLIENGRVKWQIEKKEWITE